MFVRSFVCLLVYVFLNVDNIANHSVNGVLFVTYLYIYIFMCWQLVRECHFLPKEEHVLQLDLHGGCRALFEATC